MVLDSTIHTLTEANNDDLESHYSESDLEEPEETTPVERYVSGDLTNKKDLN